MKKDYLRIDEGDIYNAWRYHRDPLGINTYEWSDIAINQGEFKPLIKILKHIAWRCSVLFRLSVYGSDENARLFTLPKVTALPFIAENSKYSDFYRENINKEALIFAFKVNAAINGVDRVVLVTMPAQEEFFLEGYRPESVNRTALEGMAIRKSA